MENILHELAWRGMIYDQTEGIEEALARGPLTLYNGFDPTADSLHIGHLVPMMALARWQRAGHTPIALAGGGTGLIGDPSGKVNERQLLNKAQVEANVEAIKVQLTRLLDFEVRANPAQVLNNADWLTALSLVDFLRDTGKHFTVNYMLAKDSVQSRITSETGISFTEFSYMLLQSYDFQHLYEHHGCTLQTGGSDQWGNITAGVELIRRAKGAKVNALVYPLITRSDGAKFGKTEAGAVWLDPARTSPYRFYQFWLNTGDEDAIAYLKIFTWLDQPAIQTLAAALEAHPEQREAQRALAREMTAMVHGETALTNAELASEALFGGDIGGLSAAEIADIFAEAPSTELPKARLEGAGLSLADLFSEVGLTKSKGEARRLADGGGAYVNNRPIADPNQAITLGDAIEGRYLILRKGRKSYHLVRLVS